MSQVEEKSGPGVPGWVKVSGAVIIALALLAGIMMLAGHNPLQHMQHMAGTPMAETGTSQP